MVLDDAPKPDRDAPTAIFSLKRLRRMDVEPNSWWDNGSVWVPRPAPKIEAGSSTSATGSWSYLVK